MSANPSIRVVDNSVELNGGLIWHRLHSERQDICEALLKDYAPGYEPEASNGDPRRTSNWHRELLQSRLRKIDDALDRLMSGSYGICSKCGRWIEDTTLEMDPAIGFCNDCWARMQTKH